VITHKIIETPEAAVYTPFALSKLRWMANNIKYAAVQTFIIGDVTIRLEHNPSCGYQIARLSGGVGAKYEFFTSDARPIPLYAEYYYGHVTRVTMGRASARSKMINSYNGLNHAPVYNPPFYVDPKAIVDWTTVNSVNKQKVSFVQYYTTTTSVEGKTTTHYTTVPVTAIPILSNHSVNAGASFDSFAGTNWTTQTQYDVDIGWDVGQPVYKGGKQVALLQPQLPPPYWWRRGTVILAKDADGVTHPITVVTDNMSNFHFFRTTLGDEFTAGMEGTPVRFVPEVNRVTINASSFLPDWVEVPSTSTMKPPGLVQGGGWLHLYSFPTAPQYEYTSDTTMPGGDVWAGSENRDDTVQECHYLWVFNSDGSAASAIVRENRGDIKYGGANQEFLNGRRVAKVMRWGFYNVWIPPETEASDAAFFAGHGGLITLKARVPGLLSIKIDVLVTGDGPTDFTVSITPTLEVKDRWYMDVAYAMNHAKLVEKGVKVDDLLTTELEVYGDYNSSYFISSTEFPRVGGCPTVTIRNMSNGTDSTPLLQFGLLSSPDYPDAPRSSSMGAQVRVEADSLGQVAGWVFSVFLIANFPQSGYGRDFVASDLKALAFIFADYSFADVYGDIPEIAGMRLFMFGEEIYSSGTPPRKEEYAPHDLSTCPVRLPIYPSDDESIGPYPYYAFYSSCAEFCTIAVRYAVLNVHPDGHFSAYANLYDNPTYRTVDIIAYCASGSGVPVVYNKTTHRSMFNAAFKQNRGYEVYETGKIYSDGGFATAGMWL
jgi:hypothetical protein